MSISKVRLAKYYKAAFTEVAILVVDESTPHLCKLNGHTRLNVHFAVCGEVSVLEVFHCGTHGRVIGFVLWELPTTLGPKA